MPDDAVCNACGWTGGIDDLRISPRDNAADIAVCPDCLSTDVAVPDSPDGGDG